MRDSQVIQHEIDAFEAQFRPTIVPTGTPNRKRLQREADREAHERACLPENRARRRALHAELRRARAVEKRRATIAAKRADPTEQTRRWLQDWLRRLGFRREYRSQSGSAYYRHAAQDVVVRVADHDVPLTAEREDAGFTWARHGWSLDPSRSRMDLARYLVEIRQELQAGK